MMTKIFVLKKVLFQFHTRNFLFEVSESFGIPGWLDHKVCDVLTFHLLVTKWADDTSGDFCLSSHLHF